MAIAPIIPSFEPLMRMLSNEWRVPEWSKLQPEDAGSNGRLIDLVKCGYAEIRLPVLLRISAANEPLYTVWDVCGNFGPTLEGRLQAYLAAHGGDAANAQFCWNNARSRFTEKGMRAWADLQPNPLQDEAEARGRRSRIAYEIMCGADPETDSAMSGLCELYVDGPDAKAFIAATPAEAKKPAEDKSALGSAAGQKKSKTKRLLSKKIEMLGKAQMLSSLIKREEAEQNGRSLADMLKEAEVPKDTFHKSENLKDARDDWESLQSARAAAKENYREPRSQRPASTNEYDNESY